MNQELIDQINLAKMEMNSWSVDKIKSVQLEGVDMYKKQYQEELCLSQ